MAARTSVGVYVSMYTPLETYTLTARARPARPPPAWTFEEDAGSGDEGVVARVEEQVRRNEHEDGRKGRAGSVMTRGELVEGGRAEWDESGVRGGRNGASG